MMDDKLIAAIRRFNRFYTRLLGLLEIGHLDTPYTLSEARAIYEIGTHAPIPHHQLAARLKLDPGYLTRLNYKLTDLGLISGVRGTDDRRTRGYALTREGEAAFRTLDAASDASIAALLEPLDAGERRALGAAMRSIETILDDEVPLGPVVLRPHKLGELGWLIHRQGLVYNEQFGWNIEFEALIAGIYSQFQFAPDKPAKNLWVAEQDGGIVGSIFVMPSDGLPGSAQLRMLYVEPAARGQGIGAALVAQAIGFARSNGYERMRLWTHTNQDSARKLYAAAGFAIVETMPEHNFGKDLDGEIWEMRF
jgi:DNA-binding MarR family transcriptional regulator/GNAT superfamily N-acetyltransferase